MSLLKKRWKTHNLCFVKGLKLRYTSQSGLNIAYLDEGFLDLSTVRLVETDDLDLAAYPDQARYSTRTRRYSTMQEQEGTVHLRDIRYGSVEVAGGTVPHRDQAKQYHAGTRQYNTVQNFRDLVLR